MRCKKCKGDISGFEYCPFCGYGFKEKDPKQKLKIVSFSLTEEEYEKLKSLAQSINLSLKDYAKIIVVKKINKKVL